MLTNATLTTWRRRSGYDYSGQPAHDDQTGSWPCAAAPLNRTLQVGGRAVPARLRVILSGNDAPAIDAEDLVTVGGVEYRVLAAEEQTAEPFGTMSTRTLTLG